MRIVIDMQGAQTESRFRGIGRYSLSLTLAIARNAGQHEIWLAVNAQLPESIPYIREAVRELIPEERIRVFDVPVNTFQSSWANQAAELVREDFINSLDPDVVVLTSVFEGYWAKAVTSIGAMSANPRVAAVLYDLIPLLNQDQYLPAPELREYYFRKIQWMKNAALLLSISESSRCEGIQHLGKSECDIVNISTAVGTEFQPKFLSREETLELKARLGITRKIVMYAPGGFDPRKNFARLIEAYSRLRVEIKNEYQLVIVSKLNPPQRHELIELRDRYGLRFNDLVLTGYVEDEDLISLYSVADLFVFPSLHEGFGLPVLEAMACGAPVIGSNSTSIPEVIGWDAALFDPLSVESIRQKLEYALTNEGFREQLRTHGVRHAKKFSWDACAVRAIDALESKFSRLTTLDARISEAPDIVYALAELATSVAADDMDLRNAARCLAFNEGNSERQLLLDISTLVHSDAKSGIQRVVRSLLRELLVAPPSGLAVQPIYFDHGVYRYANAFSEEVLSHVTGFGDLPVNFCQGDIYLSLDLNMHLTDQVHPILTDLHARGILVCFVVYDILLAKRPDWWAPENRPLFLSWLTSIGAVGTTLLCISNSVANEVSEWFAEHKPQRADIGPRIASFHLGADVCSSLPTLGVPDSACYVLEQLRSRTSFLMVSTIEPRKGYAQALAAIELLWERGADLNLVIVGKSGWLVSELIERLSTHPEREKRLFWLEGISDEYLELVYKSSHCLIAASEGEGFGLPLIEAAQHMLPIIARDIPVFREVAGEHAYYFQGLSADSLAAAIDSWLLLYQRGRHPVADNMPWLTWKESADQLKRALLQPLNVCRTTAVETSCA